MKKSHRKLLSEYHIDAEDRLVYVDDNWHDFARRNAAPELLDDAVLHQSLWNFIANRDVQHLYQMLVNRVRQSAQPIELPYRCDSPGTRRFLEMVITPKGEAGVIFNNWLIREEQREDVQLLETGRQRSSEFLIICSWCKLVKLDDETWVEVEEAVQQLNLLGQADLPQLSHGMCASCYQKWRRNFDANLSQSPVLAR